MELIDDNKIRMLYNLMKEKGVHNVNISMFSDDQRKKIYEGFGEQFLIYNGLWYMVNAVVSYALAKNIEMVEKKLKAELDYALKAHDYDYALLCARLLQDNAMAEFLKNYNPSKKYDNVYKELNEFINPLTKR